MVITVMGTHIGQLVVMDNQAETNIFLSIGVEHQPDRGGLLDLIILKSLIIQTEVKQFHIAHIIQRELVLHLLALLAHLF